MIPDKLALVMIASVFMFVIVMILAVLLGGMDIPSAIPYSALSGVVLGFMSVYMPW